MLWLGALLVALFPIYAHWRLPTHAENRGARWLTAGFVVVLGVGVGWATGFRYFPMAEGADRWALFLIGFGVAHFPAACVLFLKQQT